jgi:5-oxopent-3-ene-1,2,5-tricarboxylate decarboxylase/2-hydroxyhepta-2,4-diene-1,7-dioate isomerase
VKRARVLFEGHAVPGVSWRGAVLLDNGQTIKAGEASYLSPIVPRQIIATHLSYRSRCLELQMPALPAYPSYFMKPVSSLSCHRTAVARPPGCRFLNFEGELAVVIGKTCSNVPVARALEYVKGYTIANDWGVHDFRHADRGSMLRVKGQDGFCPLGPWMADAAGINPDDLWLRTYVNGKLVQEAHTGTDMIFTAAYQIADLSRLITLDEDDVLLTGTPANSRPVEPGDVVAVEIGGIGRLENRVVELDRELVPVGDPPRITESTLHVALSIPEETAKQRIEEYRRPE